MMVSILKNGIEIVKIKNNLARDGCIKLTKLIMWPPLLVQTTPNTSCYDQVE